MKAIILGLVLLIAGCGQAESQKLEKVSESQLFELISEKDIQLVDVRSPREFNQARIENALNIPVGPTFAEQVSKLDKTKPIAVYCAVGGRSAYAATQLKYMGFTEIYDLSGGIYAWAGNGLKLVK